MRRPLRAEEQALWRRVTADVRRLPGVAEVPDAAPAPARSPAPVKRPDAKVRMPFAPPVASGKPPTADTLDGGWDRRLRRGMATPDLTVDLHGYTLAQAHAVLEATLTHAVASGARLLLLITGKAPRVRGSALDRPARGAIRAAIGDWLTGSGQASRIAAVRNAHPRHGGAGALYVILRRRREIAD